MDGQSKPPPGHKSTYTAPPLFSTGSRLGDTMTVSRGSACEGAMCFVWDLFVADAPLLEAAGQWPPPLVLPVLPLVLRSGAAAANHLHQRAAHAGQRSRGIGDEQHRVSRGGTNCSRPTSSSVSYGGPLMPSITSPGTQSVVRHTMYYDASKVYPSIMPLLDTGGSTCAAGTVRLTWT
jgi:hypothetical protein